MNQKKAKSIRRVCGFARVPKSMSSADRGNYRRIKRLYSSLPSPKARERFLDDVASVEQHLRHMAESRKGAGFGQGQGESE